MSDQSNSETTPLLASEPASPRVGGPGLAGRQAAFRIATTASLVTGVLTLIFLVACMVLFSGAPPTYSPPYEVYYTFAPVAAFVSDGGPPSRLASPRSAA